MKMFAVLILLFTFHAQANDHNHLVHLTCKDVAGIPQSTSKIGLAFVHSDPSNIIDQKRNRFSAAFSDVYVKKIPLQKVAEDIRDQYKDCKKIFHFKNGRFFVNGHHRRETSCLGKVNSLKSKESRRSPTNNQIIFLLKKNNPRFNIVPNKCFYFEGFNKDPLPEDLKTLTTQEVHGLYVPRLKRPANNETTTKP